MKHPSWESKPVRCSWNYKYSFICFSFFSAFAMSSPRSLLRERVGYPVGMPFPSHFWPPHPSWKVVCQCTEGCFSLLANQARQNLVLSVPCLPQPSHETCLIPGVLYNCVQFEVFFFFLNKVRLSAGEVIELKYSEQGFAGSPLLGWWCKEEGNFSSG